MTQINYLGNPIFVQLREIQSTSGTSHTEYWNIQNGEWKIKPRMERNIGGARNTALEKSNGYATNQKIMGSVQIHH